LRLEPAEGHNVTIIKVIDPEAFDLAKSKLAEYESKPDFAKTGEPSGRAKVPASKRLRFVIQKHAAKRLHYDLRLELGGVFKSWALTKGPSLDHRDKRLAAEVEDHPLDYGDFEGTYPRGTYGGGTVQIWDRGYWTYEGSGSPEEALRRGELKFALDGQRLKGSWVLVRMRGDRFKGKRNSWLPIKQRDEFARDDHGSVLLQEDRSVASGRSMAQIASGNGRAPKAFILRHGSRQRPDAVWGSSRGDTGDSLADGMTTKTKVSGQKAKKRKTGKRVRTLPTFIAPQLCTLVERPPSGPGWAHEIKFDGYRIQMRVEDRSVVLRSRKDLDWTEKFPAIANAAKPFPDCIVDGEIVALDHNGAPDFAALQTALSEGNTDALVFFAFGSVQQEDLVVGLWRRITRERAGHSTRR
jgi:bifunctional non-homologous end joining protein LigD